MKLIVGLGNPGKNYDFTRHNIGFMLIDYYFSKKSVQANWISKFDGLYSQTTINGEKVIFLKPQSYMNLSGTVVKKYVDYFKIDVDNILVISDDLDLNFACYKLKSNGSSGGHNGLKNIESLLGTQSYKRLKIGISNNKKIDTKDYVLGKFSAEDIALLDEVFNQLVDVLDDYFAINFNMLMNKYNRKNR